MRDEDWLRALTARTLAGDAATREDLLRILAWPAEELPRLLRAAREVRERYWGRRVKLCMLRNARSGLCPEDCHYCSQSAVSRAPIPRYRLQGLEELVEAGRRAVAAGARRYCMVASGRGPSDRDVEHFAEAARRLKAEFPSLEICVSLGILSEEQARRLGEAGVGWVNHNLNTSERFYARICTTHTYQDRVRTVRNVARAGLRTCSGFIAGMGEQDEDLVDLALALRELEVDSLPVNFLHPIPGTPLEGKNELDPARCLAILCMARFAHPRADLRAAGGRELHLGWFQPLALFPANSLFVDGYLTTPGDPAEPTRRMVEALGLEVEAEPSAEAAREVV
ncbi:MAG: biotin synthase [Candidatus Binatia bacterium]|nr:MAG: biotin synthase [Candidatus Binatia bacterium]